MSGEDGTGARVLLIDDDEQMRRSTEQALELAGLTVDSFAAAEDALTNEDRPAGQ